MPPPIETRRQNSGTELRDSASREIRDIRSAAETRARTKQVKPQRQLKPKWIACAALLACVLGSGVAAASEGGLVLLPDYKMLMLAVLFALLIFPVNAVLFKPIFQVLDAREERTTGTRKRAESVMKHADKTLAEYEQAVREVRAESELARKREASAARAETANVIEEARAESERHFERAQTELAATLEQSRQVLRAQVQSLADEAASRVLGRPL